MSRSKGRHGTDDHDPARSAYVARPARVVQNSPALCASWLLHVIEEVHAKIVRRGLHTPPLRSRGIHAGHREARHPSAPALAPPQLTLLNANAKRAGVADSHAVRAEEGHVRVGSTRVRRDEGPLSDRHPYGRRPARGRPEVRCGSPSPALRFEVRSGMSDTSSSGMMLTWTHLVSPDGITTPISIAW